MRASCVDRDATGGGFDGDLDDAQPLLRGEGRGLPGGATGDEERDAAGNLPVHVSAQCGLVERTILSEGGDERGAAAGEIHAGLV